MKKTLLTAALIATFGVAASANAANTGSISFTGKVYKDTCVISVNGGATVVLPTVATSAFATTAGTALTSSATPFTIALTACDNNLVSAAMAFNGSNIDTANGYLKNSLTTNNANVEIQLLNSTNAVINASTQQNAPTIALAAGTGSTTLTAQYITTATTTTAGLVASTVAFTLTYN
jgi:major type 1 subunit fimbrin (pilin)